VSGKEKKGTRLCSPLQRIAEWVVTREEAGIMCLFKLSRGKGGKSRGCYFRFNDPKEKGQSRPGRRGKEKKESRRRPQVVKERKKDGVMGLLGIVMHRGSCGGEKGKGKEGVSIHSGKGRGELAKPRTELIFQSITSREEKKTTKEWKE